MYSCARCFDRQIIFSERRFQNTIYGFQRPCTCSLPTKKEVKKYNKNRESNDAKLLRFPLERTRKARIIFK